MDIETILKMTPEEFAASWNKDDEIIETCYDALGITVVSSTPDTPNK